MTRLDNVIQEVLKSRKTPHKAWIFNEDGWISDEVVCIDTLNILTALSDYEINVSDEWIEEFLENPRATGYNTYNWSANISNDLEFRLLETADDDNIYLFCVHLGGDIRGNYSDWFAVKFETPYQSLFDLDLTTSIPINDRYIADVNPFTECYNVYDMELNDDVGEFYELSKEDLLKEIKEKYEEA